MEKPIYKHRDRVEFISNKEKLIGVIVIIDAHGTFEQSEEPSYDIEVGDVLYKHIRQSKVIGLKL